MLLVLAVHHYELLSWLANQNSVLPFVPVMNYTCCAQRAHHLPDGGMLFPAVG